MTLTEAERDYLASQPLGRLATLRPDGTLQNNPVGYAYDQDTGTFTQTSSYFSPEVIRIHPRRVISWGIEADGALHSRDIDPAGSVPASA